MRSASNDDRTSEIFGQLISGQCKGEVSIDFDRDGSWELFDDLDEDQGVSWTNAGQRYDYATVPLIPSCSTINFSGINIQGKYSPGSLTNFDNVLDINTKVRLRSGYVLKEYGIETSSAMSISDGAYASLFYMQRSGDSVILDSANSSGRSDSYFTDLFDTYYDEETYDDSTYTPAAYFVSTYVFHKKDLNLITKFSFTSSTTSGNIYYRTFNNREAVEASSISSSWTNYGPTTVGNNEVLVDSTDKFLQVAVTFDGVSWSDDIEISDLNIFYKSKIEWIYNSVFYLDSPEYDDPPVPTIPRIHCSGRDAFKKAQETDINLPDLSSVVAVTDVIKSICDKCGILYNDTSISDLATFGARDLSTGLDKQMKASAVLEKVMQVCTQRGKTRYVMYLQYDEDLREQYHVYSK